MKINALVFVLGALATTQLACQQVNSADVKTSGVYANINAEAKGDNSTQVTASLRVGGVLSNTFMELGSGETLSASSGSDDKTLSRRNLLGAISYVGTFSGDEADKAFTVSFNRADGYVSAPNTTLSLPPAFNITAPVAGTTFSRANDDIVVSWDNSGSSDEMLWDLSTSNCARESKSNVITGDSGSFTLTKGSLSSIKDHETETCDTTLWLIRRRVGTLDPAYGEGGYVVARHIRKLVFSSAP